MPELAPWGALLEGADWAAAAVFLVLILAIGETARRGWQAPDALYAHYRDNRARTKASIDADHILPELAGFVADVNAEVSERAGATEALTDSETLLDYLQSAGYRDRLDKLSQWYADYQLGDRLFDSAVKWARRKALVAGIADLALLVFAVRVVFPKVVVPVIAAQFCGALLVVTVISAAVCVAVEITARNRLGRLFRAFE